MITKNPMQLKAVIKNKAKESNITPQSALQVYCMERLLERISLSDKADCFIIKGGFLISAFIGIEHRSTMDIDATIKGFDVTKENVEAVFRAICEIQVEDQLKFVFEKVEDIREEDDYPGIRVHLNAVYETMNTKMTVDVTTGDSIVPSEIRYSYHCVYDDKVISVMAYPLENVLAEKLETVVSRGIVNTRPRDFYDIYMLCKLKADEIDWEVLKKALSATAKKRGSESVLVNYQSVINSLKQDATQHKYWEKYERNNPFVKGITYDETLAEVKACLGKILGNW